MTNYFFNHCKEVNLTRDQIDVADLNAHLTGLKEKSFNSKSALELLQPRETYILVDVKPTDIKNYFIITPLLYNSSLLTTHFLNKLQPKPPKQTVNKTQGNVANKNNNSRSSLGNIQLSKSTQNSLNEIISTAQKTPSNLSLTELKIKRRLTSKNRNLNSSWQNCLNEIYTDLSKADFSKTVFQ